MKPNYDNWQFFDWTDEFVNASIPVSTDGTFDGNWQRLIDAVESDTEKQTLQRYELFINTAIEMANRLATIPEVEKITLFGSLAKPPFRTWSPYRKSDWIFHQPTDIDLAVWVSSLESVDAMKKVRSELAQDIGKQNTAIRSEIIELFLFDSKSSKYQGRVCYFKQCPRGNRDCHAEGCGRIKNLKQMDGFKIAPDALLRLNSQILFEREPTVAISDYNLLTNLPKLLPEELIENIVVANDVRIERIISTGHSSPPDFWYDQNENEWVIVLQGSAVLEFESETRHLVAGSYVLVPAHQKHRVRSTSSSEPTVWIAVFYVS
jgi:cupin 2 domain-containing protein